MLVNLIGAVGVGPCGQAVVETWSLRLLALDLPLLSTYHLFPNLNSLKNAVLMHAHVLYQIGFYHN